MRLVLMDAVDQLSVDFQYSEMYCAFRKVFGESEFGVVYPNDVKKEMEGGGNATIYTFDEKLNPTAREGMGLESNLFLARSFKNSHRALPAMDDIEKLMSYLEYQNEKGKIGNVLNSKKGTLAQKDKINDLVVNGQEFMTPKIFYFDNYDSFKEFLLRDDGEYVLKHRFGADGLSVFPLERGDLTRYSDLDFENYIMQERLDIKSESRLIYLDGELLGSRRIVDRTHPWEKPGERRHITESYKPSEDEVEDSRNILKQFDISMGSVDWVYVGQEEDRYYLEVNGVATGLGDSMYVYDLNLVVARKLKDSYATHSI